jgi:hypothetical protein
MTGENTQAKASSAPGGDPPATSSPPAEAPVAHGGARVHVLQKFRQHHVGRVALYAPPSSARLNFT